MDYSLEVAHVYGSGKFTAEHKAGLKYARWFIDSVGVDNVSVTVMVDDVHEPLNLDIQAYLEEIKLHGVFVDHVYLESQMKAKATVLSSMVGTEQMSFDGGKRVQRGFTDIDGQWIAATNKDQPTCASLVAASLMARAGLDRVHPVISCSTKPVEAKKIVNVLPQHYIKAEQAALAILSCAGYSNLVGRVDHIFHGRDDALLEN